MKGGEDAKNMTNDDSKLRRRQCWTEEEDGGGHLGQGEESVTLARWAEQPTTMRMGQESMTSNDDGGDSW